jgi:O-antigen ligase
VTTFPRNWAGHDHSRALLLWKTLVLASAIMIYFQVYWHIWFVNLLGGYVPSTLLPIGGLVVAAVAGIIRASNSVNSAHPLSALRRLKFPLLWLGLYLLWSTTATILNEATYESTRRYLIYIYSPATIFVSTVLFAASARTNPLAKTPTLLLLVGIALSCYVVLLFSDEGVAVTEMANIEAKNMTIYADAGASYGMDAIGLVEKRFAIPGLSSTTYGPMLVPLVAVALIAAKRERGWKKTAPLGAAVFLVYCILKTVSRGPLISLLVMLGYLWFTGAISRPIGVAGLAALVVSAVTFARLSFLRIFVTVGTAIPFLQQTAFGGWAAALSPGEDTRLLQMQTTVSLIPEHPLLGMGMSNLIEVQAWLYDKDHNNYLATAAAFGILATVAYVAFLVALFLKMRRELKLCAGDGDYWKGVVLSSGVVAFSVYNNFAPADLHFMWLWYGLAGGWALGVGAWCPRLSRRPDPGKAVQNTRDGDDGWPHASAGAALEVRNQGCSRWPEMRRRGTEAVEGSRAGGR